MEREFTIVYQCGHCKRIHVARDAARGCCDSRYHRSKGTIFTGQHYDHLEVIYSDEVKRQQRNQDKSMGGLSDWND